MVRKLLLSGLALVIFGCYSPTQNIEGKDFDANSAHCTNLWKSGQNMYRNQPDFGRSTPNQNGAAVMSATSQIERELALDRYEKDCESKSGYQNRKKPGWP